MARDYLLTVQTPQGEQRISLSKGEFTLGRTPDNDVVLPDALVSGHHARLTLTPQGWQVVDLNSSNGTWLNGGRLPAQTPTPFQPGDTLQLGKCRLSLSTPAEAPAPPQVAQQIPPVGISPPLGLESLPVTTPSARPAAPSQPAFSQPAAPPAPPPFAPPAPPAAAGGRALAVLQVRLSRGGQDEHPLLSQEVSLGRADDNDIILDGPLVSRHHLRLTVDASGQVTAMDLGSLNGTRYNGQPLFARRPVVLQPGDELQLDEFHLGVRPVTAQSPAPPAVAARVRLHPAPKPTVVLTFQGRSQKYTLTKPVVEIGRTPENDIVIPSAQVSSHHARLQQTGDSFIIQDLQSKNGILYNGQRVTQQALRDGEVVMLGPDAMLQVRLHPGFMPQVAPPAAPLPGAAAAARPGIPSPSATRVLSMQAEEAITIGRAPDNTITLDHPQVSRYHAIIERLGTRRRIKDLKSANGVFINGQRIEKEAWLNEGDEVRIGSIKLRLAADQVHQLAEEGVRLDVVRINKWVTKNKNLLQDISLSIQPQEFVALVGLSGAGKSTLMDAVNGFRPATHGTVLANGTNLYQNFDMFRNDMGYVPQKDIVHQELTVYQALDYAAQLRMPADTSTEERHQRIMEVMGDLDLTERKELPIHKLSGGQLKRVSIGVELLTKPRLFFLDEPTSGLDPGTEFNMMRLLRKLADQGRTIVLITHATKNVMMCDKVIILVRGGRIAFYGPPEEALVYFDRYRTDQERRVKDIEFDDIYTILEDDARGTPEEWDQRYRQSQTHHKYVTGRLQEVQAEIAQPSARAVTRQKPVKRVSALRQFLILSMRNLKIMAQDKASLALMLALSPVIGLADFMWGRQLFNPVLGDAFNIVTMLFMMGLISILVGAMASVREIVKEIDIYKRERAIALKIAPYIFSKLWVGLVLALYQAVVFIISKWLFVGFAPPVLTTGAWIAVFVTLFIGSLSGYLMGLAISAGSPNQMVALLMVILVLVPQFLFAGALMPLDLIPGGRVISAAATTRWAFGAYVRLSGVGEQLAEDSCWPAERTLPGAALGWNEWLQRSNDEKEEGACNCMGTGIFTRCNDFPGILNSEFFGLMKPEGRSFGGKTYSKASELERAIIRAIEDSTAWAAVAHEPVAPAMPSPEVCFETGEQPATQTCVVPPAPQSPPQEPLPYDPNRDCARPGVFESPETVIRQCETFRQALLGYQDGLAQCQSGLVQLHSGLADACAGLNQCIGAAGEAGGEMQTCMEGWQADMRTWETQMTGYQSAQEGRQRAVSAAEGMLKSFWEKFGFIYDASVPESWLYMGLIDVVLLVLILFFQKRKDVI